MKRFYKDVTAEEVEGGWGVMLDGKQIKAPSKQPLIMPTKAVADLAVIEWDEQEGEVKPLKMPVTSLVNTAIDRVQGRMAEVASEIVAYGGNDLICYRADEPEDLVERQCETWDPYVAWARDDLLAPLAVTSGIIHVKQSEDVMKSLAKAVGRYDYFKLTGLHSLTTGLGSLVLALASQERTQNFKDIWQAALLEELYQVENWGEDYESTEMRDNLMRDMTQTIAYMDALDI